MSTNAALPGCGFSLELVKVRAQALDHEPQPSYAADFIGTRYLDGSPAESRPQPRRLRISLEQHPEIGVRRDFEPQSLQAADFIGTHSRRRSRSGRRTAAFVGCGFHSNAFISCSSLNFSDRSLRTLRISFERDLAAPPGAPIRTAALAGCGFHWNVRYEMFGAVVANRSPRRLRISLEHPLAQVLGPESRPQPLRAADFIGTPWRAGTAGTARPQPSQAADFIGTG